MNDVAIECPNCHSSIPITEELLSAHVQAKCGACLVELEETRAEIEKLQARENASSKELSDLQCSIDDTVAKIVSERMSLERQKIADEESRRLKTSMGAERLKLESEVLDLRQHLVSRDEKLAQAQAIQADLIKKQRELDDYKRELEILVAKRVNDGLDLARAAARKEAEDALRMRVSERDMTISSMQQTIEELRRKSEQGSQQIQGEVLEFELEHMLRSKFPTDSIQPVPKGEFGGDIIQRVKNGQGVEVGSILWEAKRTKNWSEAWLQKLRNDQRSANANLAVLLSYTLPKGVDFFDAIEGIWVTGHRAAIPVASLLRQVLLQSHSARQTSEGQQSKAESVFDYLTSPKFRHRIEAIVETFSILQEDLDKERKAITRQWAKREEQIDRVINTTVGLYGDLQGIAGRSLEEIDAISLLTLEGSSKGNVREKDGNEKA